MTYFQEQELIAQNNTFNAYGEEFSAAGEELYADSTTAGRQYVSLPIIIQATNTSTSTDATNIELLNAFTANKKADASVATVDSGAITLASGISNISIAELYASIAGGTVYKMAGLRISAANTSEAIANSDPDQAITYSIKDLNGSASTTPLNPSTAKNLFQNVKNARDVKFPMLINGFSSLKVSRISKGSVVTYELYPELMSSPSTQAVRNPSAARQSAPANLNKIHQF